MRPVIGISAYPRLADTATGRTLLHTASRHYVESVVRAGGLPVILPIVDPDEAGHALSVVHGLLVTGGGDVAPARYHAKPLPETRGVDPARDAFDFRLLEASIEMELPVL